MLVAISTRTLFVWKTVEMDQSKEAIPQGTMAKRLLLGLVAVLIATAGLALASSSSGAVGETSVTTGYKTSGVSDLIWATEHLGYDSPADLQKAGVQVIHYILAGLSGMTADECALGLGSMIETNGPYSYTSVWAADEEVALDWVTDHYCITDSQAQSYGGTILTFLAGLDAGKNGTSAVRRDPPATTTTTAAPATTTTTTAAPATTTTTTAAPATTTTTTAAPALYDRSMGNLTSGVSSSAALVSGQRDGYTFTAEAGSEITISLKSAGDTYGAGTTTDPYVVRNKLDMHLQVYDWQDTLVDENFDSDGTNAYLSIYVCSAPGTNSYTVVAQDENALSTWGDYTMTFDLASKTSAGVIECLNRG